MKLQSLALQQPNFNIAPIISSPPTSLFVSPPPSISPLIQSPISSSPISSAILSSSPASGSSSPISSSPILSSPVLSYPISSSSQISINTNSPTVEDINNIPHQSEATNEQNERSKLRSSCCIA